jgi:hypothetical protein
MTMKRFIPAVTVLLAAACSQTGQDRAKEPAAADAPIPTEPDGGIGDGAGPPMAQPDYPKTFPEALRGKWRRTGDGEVDAALCDGYQSANVGKVLTVREDGYSFFETGGRFIEVRDRSGGSIDARFDTTYADEPTSEEIRFDLRDNGETLRLSRYEGSTSFEPEYYTRCPA